MKINLDIKNIHLIFALQAKKDMRTVKLENLRNGENFKPLTSDYDDYKSGYCTKLRTEGNNVYCVQVDGRDNCWDFIMRKDDKVIRK